MISSLERYNQWNEVKKKINNLEKNINIKNGNIYLVSIGQNIGNENYGNDFVDLKENFRIFLCN